jgi:tyrosine-protein kinase Etk/Wzc
MGPIQSFQELRDFLRRRMALIVLALGVALLLSVLVALRSAPVFQAVSVLSTRVEAVADTAVGNASGGNAARLMQLIEQRLTSRETMLRLADDYEMFLGRPAQERADLMRASITLMSQAAVTVGFGSDGSLASMIIMARADTGPKSAAIANELAEMVIAETGAGRTARARQTLQFLQTEQTRLNTELRALQEESRLFMAQNYDVMSFNADVRRTELSQIVSDIQDARRDITAAESELSTLVAQNTSQRRQASLRDQIALRNAELERLLAQQAEFEPFFQRVAQAERELAILTEREARLQDRLREISGQVSAAEAALRLEADSQSATFELVEEATVPEYPISRSKKRTVMMGAVAGVILGVIGAFALELLRPALRSARQVERELGMRPVLVLPELVMPGERRKIWLGWIAGACLFILALAAILLSQQAL